MSAKDRLRQVVEGLSEPEAEEALRRLADELGDPVLAAFERAPLDDEPTSAEEDRTAEEAWDEYQRKGGIPHERVRQELG